MGWFTVYYVQIKTYKERHMMMTSTTKTNRPSSVTLISVFEIVGGLLLFYFVFSPGIQNSAQARSVWETLFFACSGLVLLVSGIGFWLMKKWAVYVFIVFAIISQVYVISVGRWNIFSLLILAVPIFVGYRHLSKMT
jgi:hypothetical protein